MPDQYPMFPFDQVVRGESVLLYGAGKSGNVMMEQIQLTGYCTCVGFIDKRAESLERFAGLPVYALERSQLPKADKIVITSAKFEEAIRKDLAAAGIDGDRVVSEGALGNAPEYQMCLFDMMRREMRQYTDEVHRHIDFTYRDIMVVLERKLTFVPKKQVVVETEYPVAYSSADHLHPHGTLNDNTRYPRFIKKCEMLFPDKDELRLMDLGCSGGGMVLEGALRGHFAIGLEGSDTSLVMQRAEWRLLRENLFTCDISKPFTVKEQGEPLRFDVITAWEVLEHVGEEDLPVLFSNIRRHLTDDGVFVASIALYDDIDPESGVNWHATVRPLDWWAEQLQHSGLVPESKLMSLGDYARGGYNPPNFYRAPSTPSIRTQHVVCRKG